jgi:hypothetical protein
MRTSFHHQPEAQHPKSPAIYTPAGRLPHLLSKSGQTRVRLACPRSAINDHCSMSEGFDHTHFHDARATVEEPSTASLTDIRLAVANKPGSPDSR